MPKHPVPKKKTAKAASKSRYSTFERRTRQKLTDRVNLVKCPDCGATRRSHNVCPECGKYKGRQVVNQQKKIDKITKVQA